MYDKEIKRGLNDGLSRIWNGFLSFFDDLECSN